jgi:hypothetical protein
VFDPRKHPSRTRQPTVGALMLRNWYPTWGFGMLKHVVDAVG